MKKILFVTLTLGYTLFSAYAGANPLNTEEAKEDTTISMNQVSDTESEKVERKTFVNVGLKSSYLFFHSDDNYSDFTLYLSKDYGIVFGKSAIADAGILEGKVGIHGYYSWGSYATAHSSSYSIGGDFGIDINFIKNDGINKWIPGVFLVTGISYKQHDDESSINNDSSSIIGDVTVGAILKAFVSKQLAIVPFLGVRYARYHNKEKIRISKSLFQYKYTPMSSLFGVTVTRKEEEVDDQFVDVESSSNSFTVQLGLGLRYYF